MAQQQMSYLSPVRPSTPLSFVVCPLESHCLHRLKEKIFQSPGSASIIVCVCFCFRHLQPWASDSIHMLVSPLLLREKHVHKKGVCFSSVVVLCFVSLHHFERQPSHSATARKQSFSVRCSCISLCLVCFFEGISVFFSYASNRHSQVCVLARWRASAISIGNHPILPPLENNGSQVGVLAFLCNGQ